MHPQGAEHLLLEEPLVGHAADLLDEVRRQRCSPAANRRSGARRQRATRERGLTASTSRSGRSWLPSGSKISLKRISSKPAVCSSRCATRMGSVRSQGFVIGDLRARGRAPRSVSRIRPCSTRRMIARAMNGLVSDPTRNRVSADIGCLRPGPAEPFGPDGPAAAISATASPAPPRSRTSRSMRARSWSRSSDRAPRPAGSVVGHGQQILRPVSLRFRRAALPGDRGCNQGGSPGHRRQHHRSRRFTTTPAWNAMVARPGARPQPRELLGLWGNPLTSS